VFCENFMKIGPGKLELHGGNKNIGQKTTPKLDRSDSDARRKPGRKARSDMEAGEGRQEARSRQETAREF